MTAESSGPATTPPLPTPWSRLLAWFVCSRVLIWTVAGLSLRFVKPGPYFRPPSSPLDWLKHWDADWFLDVAVNGYSYDPTKMSAVNFFPLYPLLTRMVAVVVRHADVAGYLVSNVLCFAAAALLWHLVLDVNRRVRAADYAVLFFLFGPVSFFDATLYAEATFACLVAASLLAARRERWAVAGICGAGAALARSEGLLLVLPLAVEYISHAGSDGSWSWRRAAGLLWCLVPLIGTIGYFGYLGMRFGDPLAYSQSQHGGGHSFTYFWDLFRTHHYATLSTFYQIWFGAAVAAGLALLLAGALLRQPLAFTVFALCFCLLHFSVKTVEGMPRFMSSVLPFYSTLGLIAARWPRLGVALLISGAALLPLSVALFVNGYWFT